MSIRTIFSDVGGVLLSNGWDRPCRRALVEHLRIDGEEFEDRHELIVNGFETGQIGLDQYLQFTLFYRTRPFTRDEVREFMFARSHPLDDSLALMRRLAATRRYLLATLNNESRELNLHRIERFGLREIFTAFFSSCFMGLKKPDEAIYRAALDIAQRPPDECVFIDDRGLNLECARRLGMNTIQFQSTPQLEHDLRSLGIEF